ncbi:hypothetical protein OC846_000431 [Tilletia horrida]|uniref:DUF1348-domain-containing protein n=1 Tax=Tilletia horrida TaxID=155126 RepID=A0AAN6GWY6_9BASI|nr:hypothetical protein OC845_001074 [Tilletia horrida]KAK0557443.1 hypothetical protein OC846_000431 [Tilletia horrida]KAK0569547.1 hypothetical protein OC861_000816 [Tilletia horrida]
MSAALVPPFNADTARAKVKKAQALWNTQNPEKIAPAYTEDSVWRNRDQFFTGHAAIKEFLTKKWQKERRYTLKKELFCWQDNKIAVQFWYEYQAESGQWRRCYGLEVSLTLDTVAIGVVARLMKLTGGDDQDWTFVPDGRMAKRQMSGNEIDLEESERWFKDGITEEEIDALVLGDKHH